MAEEEIRAGHIYVIDGLDGSGKGSCAVELAQRLEEPTIIIDYPQYDLPWGRVLKHLLYENDEDLSVTDRMLVYALNRLETVDAVKKLLIQHHQEGKAANIVFDRFFTSNIITAAYYWTKLAPEERSQDIVSWILELFDYMREIDREFIEELELQGQVIYIPLLREDDSMRCLSLDRTRQATDLYETNEVQAIAREFYLIVAQAHPETFRLFSQYNEAGSRMSPSEQANYILMVSGQKPTDQRQNEGYFRGETPANIDSITRLLEKFGSPVLIQMNPYEK